MTYPKSLTAAAGSFFVVALVVAATQVFSFQHWMKTADDDFSKTIYKSNGNVTNGNSNASIHIEIKPAYSSNALNPHGQDGAEENKLQCNMLYLKGQEECKIQSVSWKENCRPNYFIAGTRKGGTTSLHTYMAGHPNVFPLKIDGRPQDGEMLGKSISDLRRFFSELHIPKHQIVGEASVRRIINDSWKNFAQFGCKASRIFVMLRDPVERCHSQMLMRHRLNFKGMNVSDVIDKELQSFKAKVRDHPNIVTELWDKDDPLFSSAHNCLFEGAYVVHLRRLLRWIPRERIRIYWSDDFFDDPAAVVRDALAFVGEDANGMDLQKVVEQKYNTKPTSQNETANQKLVLLPELQKEMEEAMDPFNRELASLLGQTPPWMTKNNKKATTVAGNTQNSGR